MRHEEAKKIFSIISENYPLATKPLCILNVGSSTANFREKEQPHIDAFLFEPLRNNGAKILHHDLKSGEGVDVTGDLFDPAIIEQLKVHSPDIVLANNILEHIPTKRRKNFIESLSNIVPAEGKLLISVPNSYPLHLDPIDSYYRPTPFDIAKEFSDFEVIYGEVIKSSTYLEELKRLNLFLKIKIMVRLLVPFYKFSTWICVVHRFFWLFRPYKVSIVLLKKSTYAD